MNGACVGHRAILMRSMLQFAMHYGRYRRRQRHLTKDRRRKELPSSAPMPSVDIAALLDEEEENLRLRQINITHVSIMDLLGDPGNPLYAELHSMAEHYDAMLVGARALSDLPEHTRCRDLSASARGRGPAGLPKDFEVPGHEGHGQRLNCANLPQDANADPSGQTLCTAVL